MIYPRLWLKHFRARRALKNYPLYDVPHKKSERKLKEKQVQENFAYFMSVRKERLAFFQNWLRQNFGVKATLDGDGVTAVSRWADTYGGGLVFDECPTLLPFTTYQPIWLDNLAVCNVMIDLGIFLGEYLIAKKPQLHWGIYRGHKIEPATFKSDGYLRPNIQGFPRLWQADVFADSSGVIQASRDKSKIGHSKFIHRSDALLDRLRESLYLTSIPDGTETIILGDSSNEPL